MKKQNIMESQPAYIDKHSIASLFALLMLSIIVDIPILRAVIAITAFGMWAFYTFKR